VPPRFAFLYGYVEMRAKIPAGQGLWSAFWMLRASTVVRDWSSIGDGAIYRTLPVAHFPITWTNLPDAAEAYDRSVAYDLEVIVDYAARFIIGDALGDALVVVLGDHQPVAEVTRFSASTAVPIHVFSRNPGFVAPFRARGFVPGMRPSRGPAPPRGMEMLLADLLSDFSTR